MSFSLKVSDFDCPHPMRGLRETGEVCVTPLVAWLTGINDQTASSYWCGWCPRSWLSSMSICRIISSCVGALLTRA